MMRDKKYVVERDSLANIPSKKKKTEASNVGGWGFGTRRRTQNWSHEALEGGGGGGGVFTRNEKGGVSENFRGRPLLRGVTSSAGGGNKKNLFLDLGLTFYGGQIPCSRNKLLEDKVFVD